MKISQYFFPIRTTNIDYYYNCGIILPSKYLEDRIKDVQDLYPGSILLSSFKFTSDSNCSLELILDETEINDLKEVAEGLFLLNRPLPISRVKSVIFDNEEQKKRTLQGVLNGSAFIPEYYCTVDAKAKRLDLISQKLETVFDNGVDFSARIECFNRYMGGVALLGTLKNEYGEHQLDYFKLLSSINEVIKDEITVGLNLDEDSIALPYGKVFFEIEKIGPLYQHITEQKSIEETEQFILTDSVNTGIRINENRNYNLKELTKVTPQLFVVLFNSFGKYYNLNRKDSLDSFINQLNFGYISKNFKTKKNVIAFYFGMNKGYSVFRNRYTINNVGIDIKFNLESKLDSYIIESLYNYSFFGKESSSFHLLDCLFSFSDPVRSDDYDYYTVLDKVFKIRKKKQIADYLISLQNLSKIGIQNEIINSVELELSTILPDYIPNKEGVIKARVRGRFETMLHKYSESMVDFIDGQIGAKIIKDKEFILQLTKQNKELANEVSLLKLKLEESLLKKVSDQDNVRVIENTGLATLDYKTDPEVQINATIDNVLDVSEKAFVKALDSTNSQIVKLNQKRELLEAEITDHSSEINYLLKDLADLESKIESINSEMESLIGESDDVDYQGNLISLEKLNLKLSTLKDQILILEDIINEKTQKSIEIEGYVRELSSNEQPVVEGLATKEAVNSVEKEKMLNDEKLNRTLFSEKANDGIDINNSEVDIIEVYKKAFRSKDIDKFKRDKLDRIADFLGLDIKGKNRAVALSKINDKLGL